MQICNCSSIGQALANTPGAVFSGIKQGLGLGYRGISYGCSTGGNVLKYAATFFKDLAKSGASLCNNNARQIGMAAAGLAVVAAIVYCARKFFKPAPAATAAVVAKDAATIAEKDAKITARDARAAARAAKKAAAAPA